MLGASPWEVLALREALCQLCSPRDPAVVHTGCQLLPPADVSTPALGTRRLRCLSLLLVLDAQSNLGLIEASIHLWISNFSSRNSLLYTPVYRGAHHSHF